MEEGEIKNNGLNTAKFDSYLKQTHELASGSTGTDNNLGCTPEAPAVDSNGEEEEEEDYNDEEEEEGMYTLRFEGEIDPLAYTEDDVYGVQPYERFERLEHEYEALAAKKRKANLDDIHQGMPPEKKFRQDDFPGASFEELLEEMNYGIRRKSKKRKQRGRRKGSKKKVSPEITRKLGDATLYYAHGRYEEAIPLLKEVILVSPNLPDPYHTLGLIYNAIGDKKRALGFYMLAAHLTPKDASLWKRLVTWSLEQGNRGQARYCLDRAIRADPEDMGLRYHRASLFAELGEYHRAAESYEQISQLRPKNIEALKTATMLYQKSGQHERSITILEEYLRTNPKDADLSVVRLLVSLHIKGNGHEKALHYIEYAQQNYSDGKELPLELSIQAGICYVHLGQMEKAEAVFSVFTQENVNDCSALVVEVANSLMSAEHYGSALKYYLMLEGNDKCDKGLLYLNVGRCYSSLNERKQAIDYFYKALSEHEDKIDVRLDLAALLLEEDRDDESISVLSPPPDSELSQTSDRGKLWWTDGKIKLKLSNIYKSKGLTDAFVEAIFPLVRESLFLETIQRSRKARPKKRLPRRVLYERVQVLDEDQNDNVFQGFRPVASSYDLSKAVRAKRLLQKKETEREERRAEALAAGIEWKSDDSDDESRQAYREPPLPNLLKDEEHIKLIIDLCKALISLQKYWEALEIITASLKLAQNTLTKERQEELRSLGAQIAYKFDGSKNGRDCARYIVTQNPYSFSAWNCYYKIISRSRLDKHSKFLHEKFVKYKDCVPVILIKGHQLTVHSQHQAAAREYLKAYKIMPENALVNLCVGTALINLALGLRLHNKHQCVLQGLAFLYNNLRFSGNSQEALYNLARAHHHVGLISLAAKYYEKVLAIHQKDYPLPKLANEGPDLTTNDLKPGYCDLRREAAYNLHLIYKNSGALDLARQVLKDHCCL